MARPNVRVNGQNLEDLNEDEVGAFSPRFLLLALSNVWAPRHGAIR